MRSSIIRTIHWLQRTQTRIAIVNPTLIFELFCSQCLYDDNAAARGMFRWAFYFPFVFLAISQTNGHFQIGQRFPQIIAGFSADYRRFFRRFSQIFSQIFADFSADFPADGQGLFTPLICAFICGNLPKEKMSSSLLLPKLLDIIG
jgi:hypothetical protein